MRPWSNAVVRMPRCTLTSADLHSIIRCSGFETVESVDESAWILEWFAGLGVRLAAARGPQQPCPHSLTDGPSRMMNFAGALSDGTLSIHRGAFTLAP